MGNALVVRQINAIEEIDGDVFEIRLTLEDESEVVLKMDGPTLCSLADVVSQYATP
jgi:hypothetical protein